MTDYRAIGYEISYLIDERTRTIVEPVRSERGTGVNHAKFMAMALVACEEFSEGKAGRWLGWLQCDLVHMGIMTLEDAKQMNLRHKVD